MVFDGLNFVVASATAGRIAMTRVSPAGAVLDATPYVVIAELSSAAARVRPLAACKISFYLRTPTASGCTRSDTYRTATRSKIAQNLIR